MKKTLPKKVFNWLIFLVGLGLIVSLTRDILRLLKADDRIKQAQLRVEKLERENIELSELREYYQSEAFIESQARNKLNLAREEETVVILPPNVSELVGWQEPTEPEQIPSWRQWLQLFF